MKTFLTVIGAVLLNAVISLAVNFYGAYVFMTVYNATIPQVTGWMALSFWHAYLIGLLFSVVFMGINTGLAQIMSQTQKKDDDPYGPRVKVKVDIVLPIVEVIMYSITLLLFVIFKGLI